MATENRLFFIAQKVREFFAVGDLGFDAQEVGHEIDDGERNGDSEEAEQNQNDAAAFPLIVSDFVHVSFVWRWC